MTDKTIVAVLAHPDDEMGFASVLAHYAARGGRIHLVSLTPGQKGFRDHAGISEVEALVQVRKEELRSSCRILGLEPPRILDFVDGELPAADQGQIRTQLQEVLDDWAPDVVLTFGPEGVTGHPDHRTVSAFVTEVLQARGTPGPRLFYHALTGEAVARFREETGRTLLGVEERYLTTRVEVSEEAVEAALRAIGEYRSQFSPDFMTRIQRCFRETLREVWFRRAFPSLRQGKPPEGSLFQRD